MGPLRLLMDGRGELPMGFAKPGEPVANEILRSAGKSAALRLTNIGYQFV